MKNRPGGSIRVWNGQPPGLNRRVGLRGLAWSGVHLTSRPDEHWSRHERTRGRETHG